MDATQNATAESSSHRRWGIAWVACMCVSLLAIFAFLSYSAVLTKNATIDEPDQAMSAWLELHHGDFRVLASPPALWQAWGGLGNLFTHLNLSYDSPVWKNSVWDPAGEVAWSSRMLFATAGNDGDAFINRDRAMMLMLGVSLGAVIAFWSYQLAGAVATTVATTLFCLDPNFLAHAPLMKGDVAFSLVFLALALAVWRVGQSATVARVICVGILCGVQINLKFTGFIVGPLLAGMLLIRTMLPQPWSVLWMQLCTRGSRLLAGISILVFAALCCFVITWGSYGFRYRVAPSPVVRMDMAAFASADHLVEAIVKWHRAPTSAELAQCPASNVARFVLWADEQRFLPQAMLAGLLHQHTCSVSWPAFLDGDRYDDGRWSYFPLAMLYKTPMATLLIYAASAVMLLIAAMHRLRSPIAGTSADTISRSLIWTVFSLGIPCLALMATCLQAHLNIGIRSVLPVVPLLQIGAGCAAAIAWQYRIRLTCAMLILLAIGLVTETLRAWPDYIAFFNVGVGGESAGLAHLGDSNLDWGQDIKNLADWQKQHADLPMFADLFHSVDPQFYGLHAHPLAVAVDGPNAGKLMSDIPMTPGIIAISATHLQGLYITKQQEPFYQALRKTRPVAVISGTIFLYEYRPPIAQ